MGSTSRSSEGVEFEDGVAAKVLLLLVFMLWMICIWCWSSSSMLKGITELQMGQFQWVLLRFSLRKVSRSKHCKCLQLGPLLGVRMRRVEMGHLREMRARVSSVWRPSELSRYSLRYSLTMPAWARLWAGWPMGMKPGEPKLALSLAKLESSDRRRLLKQLLMKARRVGLSTGSSVNS